MAILTVGSGQTYATIAAAVAASRDGDTVQVQAGIYTNDFAEISTKITLEGVGGMVHVQATIPPPDGKAIFTTNTDVTFDRFELSGAAVADQNGAGIRQQGGNLTILNSHIHHNQMGLLTTSDPDASLTIRNSEFDHNGNGAEHNHNLYVNDIGRLTVENSYFHDAEIGHQLKSRAQQTIVTDSRFADLEGTASYSIDVPNGGRVVLRDNVIEQGPNSDNPAIVAFGEEGNVHPGSWLEMSGTTVINRHPGGTLLWNAAGAPAAVSDTEVYGLDAGQLVSGPATVTGTSFLDAAPAHDTSSPWQGTTDTPEEPEPEPEDPGTPADPVGEGPTTPEVQPGDPTTPEPVDGLVLDGTRRSDVLTGQDGDDTITGGGGRDWLTGGEGADTFVYGSRRDRGDHITDFDPAGDGDRLDLTNLFRNAEHPQDLAGLLDEGYLRLSERWGDVRVSVDRDGGGGDELRHLLTLDDQTIANLGGHFVIA